MKLFDKIKDLFMDEVAEEEEGEENESLVEEVKPKKEKKKDELPKVMRETIKKEEKTIEETKDNDDGLMLREHIKKNDNVIKEEKEKEPIKNFNSTFDFEIEYPTRRTNLNVMDTISNKDKVVETPSVDMNPLDVTRKVTELYPKKEEVKPKFKASPVISPVYGVLDKNYKKEEVKEKTDEPVLMKRPSKKVDFETVRRKAFGNLVEDIKDNLMCENCELYKEVKKISSLKEDDLLYDMTVDDSKDVTIEKAYDDYEEFGVAYEPKVVKKEEPVKEEELIEDIKEELDDVKEEIHEAINADIEEAKEEIHEEKQQIEKRETFNDLQKESNDALEEEKVVEVEDDIPTRQSKKKESKVDEDFFELIDSMYKERVDE